MQRHSSHQTSTIDVAAPLCQCSTAFFVVVEEENSNWFENNWIKNIGKNESKGKIHNEAVAEQAKLPIYHHHYYYLVRGCIQYTRPTYISISSRGRRRKTNSIIVIEVWLQFLIKFNFVRDIVARRARRKKNRRPIWSDIFSPSCCRSFLLIIHRRGHCLCYCCYRCPSSMVSRFFTQTRVTIIDDLELTLFFLG